MDILSASEYFDKTVRELLDKARAEPASSHAYYFPAAYGAEYPAFYLRDFCYMVEGAAEFIPLSHVRENIDLFVRHITEDGLCPERFYMKEEIRPVYICHGNLPAVDPPFFLIKLLKAYLEHFKEASITLDQFRKLQRALSIVPTDRKSGLVWIDPQQAHTGYGFMDTIGITGCNLFCSLLLIESLRIMAEFAAGLNKGQDSKDYKSMALQVTNHLDDLWDEGKGMYLAGSANCRQADIWGSVYACRISAVGIERKKRIAEKLWKDRKRFIYRGYVRHLFEPEFWERMIVKNDFTEPGKFQNGAYWSTPTGWLAELWDSWRSGSGKQLLIELVDEFQAHSIWECIHPSSYRRLENNLSSIVLPFQSFKNIFIQ